MTSASKKPTIKSLIEEIEKLKEQLKDYLDVKQKVLVLETKIDALENERNREKVEELAKCRKCKLAFVSRSLLLKYVRENHPIEVQCALRVSQELVTQKYT